MQSWVLRSHLQHRCSLTFTSSPQRRSRGGQVCFPQREKESERQQTLAPRSAPHLSKLAGSPLSGRTYRPTCTSPTLGHQVRPPGGSTGTPGRSWEIELAQGRQGLSGSEVGVGSTTAAAAASAWLASPRRRGEIRVAMSMPSDGNGSSRGLAA